VLRKLSEGQAAAMTPAAQEAQERMRALFSKHPELMPAPTPNPAALQNVLSNLPPRTTTNVISIPGSPGPAAPAAPATPGAPNAPAAPPNAAPNAGNNSAGQ
jgi:hypothetical protein